MQTFVCDACVQLLFFLLFLSFYIPLSAQCYRLQASHLSLQLDENEEHFLSKNKKIILAKKNEKKKFRLCVAVRQGRNKNQKEMCGLL